MMMKYLFSLFFFFLCFMASGQEDKYVQLEAGSFKIFSDRGIVSGFNIRVGGGNLITEFLAVGFETFYNRADFDDSLITPLNRFWVRSPSANGSGGLTGIATVKLVPLITDLRSTYSFDIDLGFGTTVSTYEIFAWHGMVGGTIGYEIDRNLSIIVSLKGYYFWSNIVMDDTPFEDFVVDQPGILDRYRTLNAGFRIVF